jgi:hypothetical protein
VYRRGATLLLGLALAACGTAGPEQAPGDVSSNDAAPGDAHVGVDAGETGGDDATEGQGDPPIAIDAAFDAPKHDAPPDGGDASATTTGASLLAEEAAREVTAMISSTYQHTTLVDESKGVFDYDCSGFVDYALAVALPDALETLKSATEARPLAKDFETFFEGIATSTGRWHRVARAKDLVPGDVVAWLKPADVASSNTGHVMIVRELPTLNTKDTVETEWLVPITDSTESPHGPSDSRTATGTTGLGTGTIGLVVDATGAPIEYRWTGGYSTKRETTSIALGHLD